MPQSLSIESDSRFIHNGREAIVKSVISLERVQIQYEGTGIYLTVTPQQLKPLPDKVQTVIHPIESFPKDDVREAERRLDILRGILSVESRSRKIVAEHARANKISTATLYRWLSAYLETNRISALIPLATGPSRGSKKLDSQVENILNATIEDYYFCSQKPSIQETFDEIEARCRRAGIRAPHKATVYRRIHAESDFKKACKRTNEKIPTKLTGSRGTIPGADYPLSIVQIDHTPMDIIVVDEEYRLPIGRANLTLAIDVFSRMVVGFYISLDPVSCTSVAMCAVQAILPKEHWLTARKLEYSWPCWGKMKIIHADNGSDFKSGPMELACKNHNIEVHWRPINKAHFGAHVERVIGTAMKKLHKLQGTTFSNVTEKGKYDSEKKSCFTLRELEKWVAIQIIGVYHQRYHRGINTTPVAKWSEGILGTSTRLGTGLPPIIKDELSIFVDFLPAFTRTVQPSGVELDYIFYYDDVLRPFIKREGFKKESVQSYLFKRDPRDISKIYFLHPETHSYTPIPYRNTGRPSLSIWEHKELVSRVKQLGISHVNEDVIFRARDEMEAIEKDASQMTKRKRRKAESKRHYARQIVQKSIPESEIPTELTTNQAPMTLNASDIQPFEEVESFYDK